jgi:hypothetical protein
MPTEFNRPAFEDIHRRCLDLGARKCKDYGRAGDGIAMAGVRGIIVRNLDKQLRCLSLTEPGYEAQVTDESLKDTLMDQINYCTYAVAMLEGTWGKAPAQKEMKDFELTLANGARIVIPRASVGQPQANFISGPTLEPEAPRRVAKKAKKAPAKRRKK